MFRNRLDSKSTDSLPVKVKAGVPAQESTSIFPSYTHDSFKSYVSNIGLRAAQEFLPPSTWAILNDYERQHGFFESGELAQRSSQRDINDLLLRSIKSLEPNALDLQTQGYEIAEVTFQLCCKNVITGIEETYAVTTKKTGEETTRFKRKSTEDKPSIITKTQSIKPAHIPYLVTQMRSGNVPQELPKELLTALDLMLRKNPDLQAAQFAQVEYKETTSTFYHVTTTTSVSFTPATLVLVENCSKSSDLSISELSLADTASNLVAPSQPPTEKIISKKMELSLSAYRRHLFYALKDTVHPEITSIPTPNF